MVRIIYMKRKRSHKNIWVRFSWLRLTVQAWHLFQAAVNSRHLLWMNETSGERIQGLPFVDGLPQGKPGCRGQWVSRPLLRELWSYLTNTRINFHQRGRSCQTCVLNLDVKKKLTENLIFSDLIFYVVQGFFGETTEPGIIWLFISQVNSTESLRVQEYLSRWASQAWALASSTTRGSQLNDVLQPPPFLRRSSSFWPTQLRFGSSTTTFSRYLLTKHQQFCYFF